MSVPAYVKTNARESAYLSKLTQQCLTIRQDVADAKRKPQKLAA